MLAKVNAARIACTVASFLVLAFPRLVEAQIAGISEGGGDTIVAMENGDTFLTVSTETPAWMPGPNMLAQAGLPPTQRVVGLVSSEHGFNSEGLYAMTDAGTMIYRSSGQWGLSINIFQSAGRPPGQVIAFGGRYAHTLYAVADGGDAFAIRILIPAAVFIGNIFNAPTPTLGTTWGAVKDSYRR